MPCPPQRALEHMSLSLKPLTANESVVSFGWNDDDDSSVKTVDVIVYFVHWTRKHVLKLSTFYSSKRLLCWVPLLSSGYCAETYWSTERRAVQLCMQPGRLAVQQQLLSPPQLYLPPPLQRILSALLHLRDSAARNRVVSNVFSLLIALQLILIDVLQGVYTHVLHSCNLLLTTVTRQVKKASKVRFLCGGHFATNVLIWSCMWDHSNWFNCKLIQDWPFVPAAGLGWESAGWSRSVTLESLCLFWN